MAKLNLSVRLGRLRLASPVMVSSGTFAEERDCQHLLPRAELGALVTKTITLKPRRGNPPPRIAETSAGMLNSIGLENPGVEGFLQEKLPVLARIGLPLIVSIAEETPAQFAQLARRLSGVKAVSALELNISCPNLSRRCLIAQDARATYQVVRAVKRVSNLTVITKLSPNVTDITRIARAAEEAGSEALSLVNTFLGMAVDIDTRRPKLGGRWGGLSGPAIKPQALWMVRRVFGAVKVPLIGMGGIIHAEDALEFIICGATAIAVGTANFLNPRAGAEILAGIKRYLQKKKISSVKELIGSLRE